MGANSDEKLIFPIGFDLEEGVKEVESQWKSVQKRLENTFKANTIQVDADISEKVLNNLYKKFEGLIKSLETKAPQIKLKMPNTVDFEEEIKRLKVQLKSINLGELTEGESKDLYLYIRQLEALAKALKEVNKQEQLRQAKDPANIALRAAQAEEKRTRAIANNALAEQRRAKIATESARQVEINNRSAQRSAILAEQKRAATARAEIAELRHAQAQERSARATQAQNQAYATQSTYLQRLIQRMGVYFGLHTAVSFVRNIRDVTKEFELQRVALGSIIGDLNEANAMFEQIKAAAVKSPFQIKELVSYTKQLAAYKIETDELFETTQKLADISAGLGVGMERLVLAYGQIRATGYLRASEVRQLTEAGIPIVEELAKKMAELRGETISAAEVMGMISERAISFGMVKEVFDDMTSAGGMFYKMQEKQAETLAGQWSNLQDSVAIMYEEIGNTEGVNNAMKGMISLIKSLAENWRIVSNVATWSLGAALGYAKVIKPISDLIKKQILLNKAKQLEIEAIDLSSKGYAKQAQGLNVIAANYRQSANAAKGFGGALKSIGTFIKGNIWGILLTALASIVAYFISARKEAKRLNEELNKIGTEGALQADQSVRNFERLAKTIRESANGSREQSEALAEMKRTYGDLLPTQDEEVKALVRVKGGYEDVTRAIREKIDAQIYEQKMNKIISEYGEDVTDYESKLVSFFKGLGLEAREAYYVINRIKQETESGNIIPKSYYAPSNARKVVDIIKKELGIATVGFWDILPKFQESNMWFGDELLEYSSTISDMKAATDAINDSFNSSINITRDYRKKIEELNNSVNLLLQGYDLTTFEGKEKKIFLLVNAWKSAILKEFTDNQIDIGDAIKFDGKIDFKDILSKLEGKGLVQLEQFVKTIQKEYEKLVPEDLEQLIKERFISLGNQMGISLDKLQHYFKDSETSTQDWVKSLKEAKETIGTKIFDAKKLGQDTKELEGIQKILDIISKEWDNSKKIGELATQALKDELSAVEKIYKRYAELRKLKSEVDTQKILAEEFKGVNLKMLTKAYSPEQMLEVYQDALKEAQRLGEKDLVLEIQTKIGELNLSEEQREMEGELKRLSDQISRTKTAKEFFDRMLGMTGDKQLSATLTLSVYGTTGDDLQRLMSKQVEDAFKNLPEGFDITKAMLGGGKFDYNLLESWIEKLPEQDRKSAQSIVENWRKTNQDIITDLYKTYEEFLSFEERKTRVVEKENAERMRIINSGLPMAEQEKLIGASQKRENKALADIAIEEFKASEDWAKSFEDLEHLATPTIERLMAKLKEFIDTQKDLTPEQLKTLTNEYKKLYDGLIARNPFRAMTDGIKEYVAATKDVKTAKDRVETAQEELRIATERKAAAEQNFKTSQDVATAGREYASAIKEYNKASQNAADADKDLGDALDAQKTALNKTIQGFNAASSAISNFGSIITDITEILGIAEDSEIGAFIKDLVKWLGVMASVLGTVAAIIAVIEAELAPLLAIAAGIAAIGAAISFFSNAKVRKADKEIKHQQDLIDSLGKSYEKLEKQIEKTFGSDYLKNYNDRLANLYAQQEAYLKQAEAERSKGKKADQDKIDDYTDKAQEAAEQIADMQQEVQERMLGTDLASAARDFAQAWIDAYKEFGSTTDAMSEKFHDMIQNMVVESLAGQIVQSLLKPLYDNIEKYTKDGKLDESEIAAIADSGIGLIDNIDGAMTSLVERLRAAGYDIRTSSSGLTGISKDIASASEESILGLAAGINTQNFYISQVPPKLDTIIGLLQGGGASVQGGVNLQDLMTIQNQHLSYLPTIAQHTSETVAECKLIVAETKRTADALERVIKPRGTQASHTLNTSL